MGHGGAGSRQAGWVTGGQAAGRLGGSQGGRQQAGWVSRSWSGGQHHSLEPALRYGGILPNVAEAEQQVRDPHLYQ